MVTLESLSPLSDRFFKSPSCSSVKMDEGSTASASFFASHEGGEMSVKWMTFPSRPTSFTMKSENLRQWKEQLVQSTGTVQQWVADDRLQQWNWSGNFASKSDLCLMTALNPSCWLMYSVIPTSVSLSRFSFSSLSSLGAEFLSLSETCEFSHDSSLLLSGTVGSFLEGLNDPESLEAKVQHDPSSVFAFFTTPAIRKHCKKQRDRMNSLKYTGISRGTF